jgi:6-phospho-beta-glucosidase
VNLRQRRGHGGGPGSSNGRFVLSVLGGTSVGTPALIRALSAARQAGRLPDLELRLHGRALLRGERLIDHAAGAFPLVGRDATAGIRVRLESGLRQALSGSDAVVCQVRPGGMNARADDEAMAVAEGVPGDEGLGPSGLASFLRGRRLLDAIAETWAAVAPQAVFLQLTSPLGLTVARATRRTGRRVLGVCELPATTSAALLAAAAPTLGPLHHAHFGLNHLAWLYAFTDADGRDRTREVIAIATAANLLPVDAAVAHREGAVPLSYLRLFYHRDRVAAEQRRRARTRGREVAAWSGRLHALYLRPGGVDAKAIGALLRQRRMNWYDEAVVPVVAGVCSGAPFTFVLNVTGVRPETAVELPCRLRGGQVTPLPQPALPEGPQALFERLVGYERAVLDLPERLDGMSLADAIARHPFVDTPACAERLALRILERLANETACMAAA